MKTPLPIVNMENPITQPAHPTGYVLYSIDELGPPKKLTQVPHLCDVREYCVDNNFTPLDVLVYREFSDGKLRPMFIHEFSYRTTITNRVGGLMTVSEAWSWVPEQLPNVEISTDPDSTSLTYTMKMNKWTKFKFRLYHFFQTFSLRNLFKNN